MAQFTFSNFVNTTLASPVSNTATTITLASSTNLPTGVSVQYPYVIVLNDAATRSVYEVVYATAISGATLTVLRGQEGTTAQSWLTGDYAYNGVTAGQMSSQGGFTNPMTAAGDLITGGYLGTPTRLGVGTPGYVLTAGSGAVSWQPSAGGGGSSGVTSFNTRTGAVVLNGTDVVTALTYTPFSIQGGSVDGATAFQSTVEVAGAVTMLSTLTVSNNVAFQAAASVAGNLTVTGATITHASDYRIKSNIVGITGALNYIDTCLRGVEYDFKATGEHSAGFIAQEVERGLPHLVKQCEHDGMTDFRTLNYNGIIPYLCTAISELHQKVRHLEYELKAQK